MPELSPLLSAVPFLLAALLVASLPLNRRRDDVVAVVGASAVVVLAGVLLLQALGADGPPTTQLGGFEPRANGVVLGIVLVPDVLGVGLCLLAAVLVVTAVLFAWRFFDAAGPLFHALLLVLLGALCGFALAGDLFTLFVLFELMSVAAYALTGYRVEQPAPLQGALTFAVTNTVGAVMILFGIAMVYGRTGALNLVQVGEALAGKPADGTVVMAFALIAGGFFVKAAIVPFHFWLADAYAVAPTPAAIVFTGVMSDLGIYAVARIYWTSFEGALAGSAEELRLVLVLFGAATCVWGTLMCLVQVHLKRLLAFLTMAQIGVVLVGVGLLNAEGLGGSALLVATEGPLRAGLFVCLGAVAQRCGTINELRLHGRGRELPLAWGLVFVAGVVGLAGLPPLGAFTGKAMVEQAAVDAGLGWVVVVLELTTVLTCAALLRAAARVFLGRGLRLDADDPLTETGKEVRQAGQVPGVMLVSAGVLVGIGLLLAVVPGIADGAQDAAQRFTQREAYVAAVLERPLPPLPAPAQVDLGWLELVAALVGAFGAIAVAGVLLHVPRSGLTLPIDYTRPVGRALLRLRRLHSGQVGDYVAWTVVGFALLSGALALAV